jgi:type IV pilus assembly protein PilA
MPRPDEARPIATAPQFASKLRGFTLIELMIVVAIVGILAVLAVVGVRRYLSSAKSAEARNGVAAIGKRAAIALERPTSGGVILGAGASQPAPTHSLCPSAANAVPSDVSLVSGKKYQSNNTIGVDFNKAGFECIRFEVSNPQSYQYNYVSDTDLGPPPVPGNNITATAIGNLNGDSVYSTFRLYGSVQSKALTLAPSLEETNPDE